MNASDLKTLKAEIKAEILQEMRKAPGSVRVSRPWNNIRSKFLKRLESYSANEQYKITNAISTIVRLTLGLQNVLYMSDDQSPTAEAISNKIIDVLNEYKNSHTPAS